MTKKNSQYRKEFESWYERLIETYSNMTQEERLALEEWERENLDGHSVGTSDWPGWEKYIGVPPGKCPLPIS